MTRLRKLLPLSLLVLAAGCRLDMHVQPRYNPLFREIETELVPLCRDQGVGIIAYNPLAGGFLTGKHRRETGPAEGTRFTLGPAGAMYQGRYWHASHFDAVERLQALLAPRGLSLVQVALAWVLRQPGISAACSPASASCGPCSRAACSAE